MFLLTNFVNNHIRTTNFRTPEPVIVIQLITVLFSKMKLRLRRSNMNNPVQMSETNAARGYEKSINDFGGKFAPYTRSPGLSMS